LVCTVAVEADFLMSLTSASESERKLDEVKNECWHNGDSGFDIDSVLQRVSQLHAQLEVQKVLQRTEKLLLQAPSNKAPQINKLPG